MEIIQINKQTNLIDNYKNEIYKDATVIKDISWKLKILTDAAKYDVACTSSGVDRKGNGRDSACLTASIVLTVSLMMFQEPHLLLMRYAGLPWNFTDAII